MPDLDIFKNEFVPNIQGFNKLNYLSWKSSNPGEAKKWEDYRDALLAGGQSSPPSMATKFGRALVATGKLVAVVEPPPPPPSGQPIPISGIISAGGTYTGNYTGTVQINTGSPVTLSGPTLTNLGNGHLISCAAGIGVQLTVERVWGFGGMGRFLVAENFRSVVIRNCTVEKTRGIELQWGLPGSSVAINRNQFKNIQGSGTSPVGNFVQFRECQNPAIEVSWNEILNEYNKSGPEDLISLYKSSHSRIFDNFFRGQYTQNNSPVSSQNGITLEGGDIQAWDNIISRNQLISTMGGIGFFGGSHDNLAEDNRVVRAGLLPDGVTRMAAGWSGNWIAPGGANNHQHGNVVGFVNRDGNRMDYDFPGAPEGHAGEVAKNTSLPNPVTPATEQNEWDIWQQKLVAAGVVIGATL